jgi:hypothetical protein
MKKRRTRKGWRPAKLRFREDSFVSGKMYPSEELLSLAERLAIPARPFRGPISLEKYRYLVDEIGTRLIDQQPEFQEIRRGRPAGSRNKQLCNTDNKETQRKRRQRERLRKEASKWKGWDYWAEHQAFYPDSPVKLTPRRDK